MFVVHYLPYSYHIHTGGLEKIAQTISDGLAREGVDQMIFASDVRRGPGNALSSYHDTHFIPSFDLVYNFPVPKFWTKAFWHSFHLIKHKKHKVIITHTRFFVQSLIGGLISKRLGCKRVHVEHGSGFVKGYPWHIRRPAWCFDWTVGLWIFRHCDEIVTISQMHRKFIKKFTSKNPFVIYNPIDFTPQSKEKNEVLHIGFVGRLVSLKGVDLLIQALDKLRDKQWRCTIVGEGDQRKVLESLVKEKKLSDHITFVGADDRANRLHRFDIFVNPSHQEGLPTTVVEALLAQCVVVATDVGGTREISDQDDLILVKPGSVSALVSGLQKAFERLDTAGMSLKEVKERFGMESAIGKYREIIGAYTILTK